MLTTIATALLVSWPARPAPRTSTIARPLASWLAGDGDRTYRLDLYANEQCAMGFGSAALAIHTWIPCRWKASDGGIAIYRMGTSGPIPNVNELRVAEFRFLDDGHSIQLADDPRLTLNKVR